MSENKTQTGQLMLGDVGSDAVIDAATSDRAMKLENATGDNIFALVDPGFKPLQEHWFEIDDQRMSCVCAVHATEDNAKIVKGFVPDECRFCAKTLELYREAKDESDPYSKKKKDIANDLRAGLSYIFMTIKGIVDSTKRVGGKRILTPGFDSLVAKPLMLTAASFEMLRSEFRAQGLNSADAIGLPVNFIRGKKKAKDYFSQVLSIEFYSKYKITRDKLPKNLEITGFGIYKEKEAEELFEKWNKGYAALLKGMSKNKGKKIRNAKIRNAVVDK